MLSHELSCHKGGLLLSLLMLKDACRNYYAVSGVDPVVSHESRHLADDGHKALLHNPRHLLRVSDALVSAHHSVPSWCSRTSLVAQTAGHTRVAEVAHEAVGRARLIPEDVRLVTPKVVADYGVVDGLRRPTFDR